MARVPAPTTARIFACARVLQAGGCVAFPTETVYGLGADALNPAAAARLFALKGRPADHPLIVHLAPPAGYPAGNAPAAAWRTLLEHWAVEVPEPAVQLARQFWPGPLTLILRKHPAVQAAVTGGEPTVGLRVPAHPLALELLTALAGLHGPGRASGVAAPSANRFGAVSPTTAEHVHVAFADELCAAADVAPDGTLPAGRQGCVLDGGPCQIGLESTIVDLSAGVVRILRPGAVTAEQLGATLPLAPADAAGAGAALPRVGGSLPQHYAPHARVVPLEHALGPADPAWLELQETTCGPLAVLGPQRSVSAFAGVPGVLVFGLPDDMAGQAHELYAALRRVDGAGVAAVGVVLPPPAGLGLALRDRIRRAAGLGGETADDP
jgi:L-threonylcarbamoyladenylate synthase